MKRLQQEPNLSVVKEFKCDPCKKTFHSKKAFKEHRKENHEQKIKCKYCDESFMENWKLEIHLRIHAEANKFTCEQCSKDFHLEWRLRKHQEIHLNKSGKKCHYFNNF